MGLVPVLQSLDYDNSENQLFLEEERRINHTVSPAGGLCSASLAPSASGLGSGSCPEWERASAGPGPRGPRAALCVAVAGA